MVNHHLRAGFLWFLGRVTSTGDQQHALSLVSAEACNPHGDFSTSWVHPGGVLRLEKGTDCGMTAAELWLSQAKIAEEEGLSSHPGCAKGAVKLVYIRILHQITNVCIQSCS